MFWQVIKTACDGDTREISGPVTEEKIIYMRLCQYISILGMLPKSCFSFSPNPLLLKTKFQVPRELNSTIYSSRPFMFTFWCQVSLLMMCAYIIKLTNQICHDILSLPVINLWAREGMLFNLPPKDSSHHSLGGAQFCKVILHNAI